ncbi:hypothetical protein EVAR_65471_1 [Eumeta japonica]|uniref:Uncharacterized protein n=1 Tax=Eumeta variegata TaxID=151549 RepID=A0A4C1YWG7_EUMVA|nr:hypothetical protein EVAR_65471_1 [Eumeta japonica]
MLDIGCGLESKVDIGVLQLTSDNNVLDDIEPTPYKMITKQNAARYVDTDNPYELSITLDVALRGVLLKKRSSSRASAAKVARNQESSAHSELRRQQASTATNYFETS